MVTPVAVPSNADWLIPSPFRMAPGAPMKVSPFCGWNWLNCELPSVWVPDAR